MNGEGWGQLIDQIWTPKTGEILQVIFVGWLASLVVAATLKWILRRAHLNSKLTHRLPKRQEGERPLDLEDWIADAVYWIGLAGAVAFALLGN